jgi:alkylation response protein AidB-like acyl-CoA dehydrogenase
MDFRDNEEQAEWRQTVRSFLETEAPEEYRGGKRFDADVRTSPTFKEWRKKVGERGWIAPHWPKEYGGMGLSVWEQVILNEEFARARIPQPGGREVTMVGPTVIVHGTEEQKKELLPPILAGEHIYAQGYSEPGAGSDLASLQTRATRDGDDYLINGQKIWTSSAATDCNWLFMLARTDPEAPKHRGISFFVLPLETEGLTVRPIVDMAGGDDLTETFYDNVRVPAKYRIGEENRGWYVGATLLDFERSGIAGAAGLEMQFSELLRFVRSQPGNLKERNPALRLRLAEIATQVQVLKMLSLRIASMQARGLIPNYESSMSKLYYSELLQKLALTRTQALGLNGQVMPGFKSVHGGWTAAYMQVIPYTIAGGSSEIQRNIIATRGLGLPRG